MPEQPISDSDARRVIDNAQWIQDRSLARFGKTWGRGAHEITTAMCREMATIMKKYLIDEETDRGS